MIRSLKTRLILELAQSIAEHFGEEPCGEHIIQAIVIDGDNDSLTLLTECGAKTDLMGGHPLISRGLHLTSEPHRITTLSKYIKKVDETSKKRSKTHIVGTNAILSYLMSDEGSTKMIREFGASLDKLFVELNDHNLRRKEEPTATPLLDRFSTDLTAEVRAGRVDPIVGRTREIEQVCQILCRRIKNNPLLIGDPGVGKTAVVEGIAQRIVEGKVPEHLLTKRVVSLDMAAMLAGTRFRGDFEERIKGIAIDIMNGGNVILFIDEIHSIIGAGNASGGTDAANILKPYLSRGKIQLIGATTPKEEREIFEKDGALDRRFQRVRVSETDIEQTVAILKGIRCKYEDYHQVEIPDTSIESIVKMAARYVSKSRMPDKAIDVMDQTCSTKKINPTAKPKNLTAREAKLKQLKTRVRVLVDSDKKIDAMEQMNQFKRLKGEIEVIQARQAIKRKRPLITVQDVALTVSKMTGIPINDLTKDEMAKIKNLDQDLKQRVIGQDNAIIAVSKAIQRSRIGLGKKGQPIGSFLFLGPSGVGKTETAKQLARIMFGSDKSLIRFDMSEYSEKHTVSTLLGSPQGFVGYEEGGKLINAIKDKPYSVVLFDEVEKAHPDVYDVFLQIMDEGQVTDKLGRVQSFENCVIVMTSNIGSDSIARRSLGIVRKDETAKHKDMESDVKVEMKKFFRQEFINRIGNVVVFNRLTKENLEVIFDLQIKELNDRLQDGLSLSLSISPEAKVEILRLTCEEENCNARPMARFIRDKIEDMITSAIYDGKKPDGLAEVEFIDNVFKLKEKK